MSLEILDEYVRLNEEHKNQIKSQRKLANNLYDCLEISKKIKYSFIFIIPIFYFVSFSLFFKDGFNPEDLSYSYFLSASSIISFFCSCFYFIKMEKTFSEKGKYEKLKLKPYDSFLTGLFEIYFGFYILIIIVPFISNHISFLKFLFCFFLIQFFLNIAIVFTEYFVFKSKNGELKKFFLSECKNKIKLDTIIEKNNLKIKEFQTEILKTPLIIENMLEIHKNNEYKSKTEEQYYVSIFKKIKNIKKEKDIRVSDVENWRQDLNKVFNKEIKTENQKNIIIENN